MTGIIYYSDSISKTVAVFAIECAIIFGFIILLMFCCSGKLIGSSSSLSTDKDKFKFKKYSSKYKIPKEQIDLLYIKDKNEKNNKNEKKSETKLISSFKFFNCFKTNNKNLLKEESKEEIIEEIKEELKTIEEICDTTEETKKNKQVLTDIESGLTKNKIYIVYEFNNLDKMMKPSRYMESDDEDEFDKLEEFVNMIIKSFVSKYEQIGILLKISSPGGVAFKFEHAYLNLLRLKNKKIELIGMIDKMAASGGYMLASACDKIICARYATVGSVGVIAQMYNWSELSKKIGLEEKTWTTGSHKMPFPTGTSYTKEDDLRMKHMINETFDIFKSIVKNTRKFTQEQEEQIMMAKTFPGFIALELNMVDELEMSYDYIDKLEVSNNIWICEEKTKQKSFINSLLMNSIPGITIGLVERFYNSMLVDKKINNIKLM